MKRGFTLIELTGVIIIFSLLVLLSFGIANIVKDEEQSISDTMKNIIIQAGELYTQDNIGMYPKTEGNIYCIKLSELVNNEYLSNPIKDPVTTEEISQSNYIKVLIHNESYNYEFIDSCENKIVEN